MKTTGLSLFYAIEHMLKFGCNMKNDATDRIVYANVLTDATFTYEEIIKHDWQLIHLKTFNFSEMIHKLLSDNSRYAYMINDSYNYAPTIYFADGHVCCAGGQPFKINSETYSANYVIEEASNDK
jgi:hypothetical protein